MAVNENNWLEAPIRILKFKKIFAIILLILDKVENGENDWRKTEIFVLLYSFKMELHASKNIIFYEMNLQYILYICFLLMMANELINWILQNLWLPYILSSVRIVKIS